VLENCTLCKLALRLVARNGKDYDETEVERGAAMKGSCSGFARTRITSPPRHRSW